MARPLRLEYPGAVYHVMNRGNERRRVFHGNWYYETFLEKLVQSAEKFEVEIRSYCLMPNHFHLYLQTPEANLGRFMQSFLTSFTVTSNHRRKTSGHVFQGRYKALLVESEKYGSVLSRYVHLNPVETAQYKGASKPEIVKALYAYRWSSLRALVGGEPIPGWLAADAVLCRWGTDRAEQMTNYRHYVEAGVGVSLASPLEEAVAGAILGDEAFVEAARRMALTKSLKESDQPKLRALAGGCTPDEVLAAVASVCEVSVDRLTCRRGADRAARSLAMYCVDHFCRATHVQSRLAEVFGITLGAFSTARQRIDENRRTNPLLQEKINKVAGGLQHAAKTET